MITIEELKRLDADNFGIELSGIELLHTGIPVQELVRFALSQHEEIKRLRTDNAQLQFALRQEVSAYKKAEQEIERLRAALQEAADCLWNNSLNTAARKAEQALKSGEPK